MKTELSEKHINNYEDFKEVIRAMIRYLDSEAFFEENLNYDKEDVKKYLDEVINDAMCDYYGKE